MRITKYLHSCIVLEESGKRILIDPGSFSFIEERQKPEDLPLPDAIFITHEHPDHCFPDALKRIRGEKQIPVYANAGVGKVLTEAGIVSTEVKPGDELTVGPFQIRPVTGAHGALPVPVPQNTGFLVNGVLHPGDSLASDVDSNDVRVLLLPISAPWTSVTDAVAYAVRMKPAHVIPIHDGFIKDFFLKTIYERLCAPTFAKAGIAFHPLEMGESAEV